MGKLRINKEIQVYFVINRDLVGNEQGMHYGKINTVFFLGVGVGREEKRFLFSFNLFLV